MIKTGVLESVERTGGMPAEETRDARHIFNPHEKYICQTQKKTNCLL